MAVIGALGVVVCLLCLPRVWAQEPDFLHIDCGAPEQYKDLWGITWRTDDAYVSTGEVGLPNITFVLKLRNCRYFRNGRGKNCYSLPTTPKQVYMLRTEHFYGNYDGVGSPFPSFLLAIDSTVVENVTVSRGASFNNIREITFQAQRNTTSLCLLRDQTNSTAFVSAIALRAVDATTLPPYIVKWTSLNQSVSTMARVYFNYTNTFFGYPVDVYDRYWFASDGIRTNPYPLSKIGTGQSSSAPLAFTFVNRTAPIATDYPDPTLLNNVPQNAIRSALTTSGNLTIPLNATSPFTAYLQYYFVELDESVNVTDRPYFITSPGANPFRNNVRNVTGAALSLRIAYHEDALIRPDSVISMYPDSTRTNLLKGPMISALEIFKVGTPWVPPTNDRDWNGIEVVKSDMGLSSWRGDPCLPVPHDWLTCNPADTTSEASVIAIELSGYNLTGAVSLAFAGLLSVTSLKLDNNSLSGPIPDLRALKNLKTLHLQNNDLSGSLPSWLASLPLEELFVQNNNFSGTFPAEFALKNWNFNYSGNPGLAIDAPSPKTKEVNIAALVGGIAGGFVVLLAIAGLVLYCCCYRRRAPQDVGGAEVVQMANSSRNLKPDVAAAGAREYSLAEVVSATENFKKVIGRGGFGSVFYGRLPDGKEVAVKELDTASHQGQAEFFNEVDILSRVHHKRLVALVGYCRAQEKQMLIYEYIHKGSLRDHLDGDPSKTEAGVLDWKTRLNIAVQAAEGLEYLHTGCNPRLIHRDVKSNNILITSKYEAKVADFGLTRLVGEEDSTKVLTFVKGTAGYLDPEYYSTQYLSAKSDVYGVGVVLLELLTGRLPIDRTVPNETNQNICNWVRSSLEQGDIDVILDPAVRASRPSYDSLWKVAEIALRSVEPRSVHRPTMNGVVRELYGAMALEGTGVGRNPNIVPQPEHHRMPSNSGHSDYSMTSQYDLDSSSFPIAR